MGSVKCKSVFNPGVARHLRHMGHMIYDIKPKKENPEATIFLFEETEQFKKDFIAATKLAEEEKKKQ